MKKIFQYMCIFCFLFCYPQFSFGSDASKKIEEYVEIINAISFLEFGFGILPDSLYYSPEMKAWQKKALRGDIESQYLLGEKIYQNTYGADSYPEALRWLTIAADRGHFYAKCRIAQINYETSADKSLQDFEKLLSELQRRVEKDEREAQYFLGIYYTWKGVALIEKSSDKKYPEAQCFIGDLFHFGVGKYPDSLKSKQLYYAAASQGLSIAEFKYGMSDIDKLSKQEWIKRSKEKGNIYANLYNNDFLTSLKMLHYTKKAIPVVADEIRSLARFNKWLERYEMKCSLKAAEMGDIKSMMYLSSKYLKMNQLDNYLYWLNKAANYGYYKAQYYLARDYSGNGDAKVTIDWNNAFYWFTKAAENGWPLAYNDIAYCYLKGLGVEKSFEKALYFLTEARKREINDADLQYQFSQAYYSGNGVQKDSKKAFELLRDAAINGSSDAQFTLGKCYEEGIGVDKHDHFAKIWYEKAAEQGNVEAKKRLKTLNPQEEKKIGR